MHQSTPISCGPATLATVLTYYLRCPTYDEMISASGNRGQYTSLADLERACAAISYRAVPLSALVLDRLLNQIKKSNISAVVLPAIVLWDQPEGHWVVVVGQQGNGLIVSDPNQGNIRMTEADFSRQWQGGEVLTIQLND